MEMISMNKEKELANAIKESVNETRGMVCEIGDGLLDCANCLRVDHGEEVFSALSKGIENLNHLMDFICELRKGLGYLKRFDLSAKPLRCWDKSQEIFEEMLSAFERRDWVNLSDLIEFELHPLLVEGEKGLSELQEILEKQ